MSRLRPVATSEPGGRATAIIYLRVSTRDQATRGGEAEGFSIPAQREACLRKAEALNATVVEEFVDAGESARSANRPDLQRLLRYVQDNRVGYAIVHKVDRLARNRMDDVDPRCPDSGGRDARVLHRKHRCQAACCSTAS